MENKEKLIDALKTIREECRSQRICERCPIYNSSACKCSLTVANPERWKFEDETDQLIF